MKQFIIGTIVFVLVSITQTTAQPRFEVPLTVTDGGCMQVLHFGILPIADFCIVRRDSINGHGEFFLPPVSPSGTFDARIVWPRTSGGGSAVCFDQGSWNDFRPFISDAQKDTIKVQCQSGASNSISVSWPTGLSTYFQYLRMNYYSFTGLDSVDMLTQTSIGLSNTVIIWLEIYSWGPRGATDVELSGGDFPMQTSLLQNYPNPFNPSTRIGFSVPGTGYVSLKVFDLLGREVATLVEGRQERGEHSVEWKAEGLPSGVYICRLTTASSTASRKMLLMR